MFKIERLEEILKEKKMSRRKLEREAGLGVGTVAKWKMFDPTVQNIQKVADVLKVSVAWLTGESDFRSEQDALIQKWNDQMSAGLPDEVRRIEAGIRIPVLGAVPCGIPSEAVEYLDSEEWEEIKRYKPEFAARAEKGFQKIADHRDHKIRMAEIKRKSIDKRRNDLIKNLSPAEIENGKKYARREVLGGIAVATMLPLGGIAQIGYGVHKYKQRSRINNGTSPG